MQHTKDLSVTKPANRSTRLICRGLAISWAAALFVLGAGCGDDARECGLGALTTEVRSSTFHSPAGSWWGHNMAKVVRDGDRVYATVVQNDASLQPNAASPANADCAIVARDGDGPMTRVFSAPCSRPANILVGLDGAVHLIAFEATDVAANASLGAIIHYALPAARAGDFTAVTRRIVVPHSAELPDRANIRVGAAIAPDGRIAVSFGHYGLPETPGHAVVLHTFDPASGAWTERVHAPVPHEFYYPYVMFGPDGQVHTLNVMDDYNNVDGTVFNTYYRIDHFIWTDPVTSRVVVDHTDRAAELPGRHDLVEQSDLFADGFGRVHVVYKERLHPTEPWTASAFQHCITPAAGGEPQCLARQDWGRAGFNWARLFERDGQLYALLASWESVSIERLDADGPGPRVRLDIGVAVPRGVYPYVAAPRGESAPTTGPVDVLLLSGASDAYPDAKAYHVPIDTAALACLFEGH